MGVVEVASVAPGRMFRTGLAHLLIGLAWSIGPIVGFVADPGDAKVDSRVVAAVVILWPLGIPILLRGLVVTVAAAIMPPQSVLNWPVNVSTNAAGNVCFSNVVTNVNG